MLAATSSLVVVVAVVVVVVVMTTIGARSSHAWSSVTRGSNYMRPKAKALVVTSGPLRSSERDMSSSSMTGPRQQQRDEHFPPPFQRVGIVGGGLAGLSVAHHLLEKCPTLDITVIDRYGPGQGGASSVAGGLLHPLSPRGKLVHFGLEGLASSGRLIEAAAQHEPQTVLREEIYRVATDREQLETLKKTARTLPDLATWCDVSHVDAMKWRRDHHGADDDGMCESANAAVLGALRLHSGCKVIHVPSYLNALWLSCRSISKGKIEWKQESGAGEREFPWSDCLAEFDCVVLSAGAALFQTSMVHEALPTQLVRGQSIEMTTNGDALAPPALLCGKYVSPLPGDNRILVGATHEFKTDPLNPNEVEKELRERSYVFSASIWDESTIDCLTTGYRVQTNRRKNGRQPIIGQFHSPLHPNSWLFTGLSSRGLLYHGIYGDILSRLMLGLSMPDEIVDADLDWWQK